MKRCVGVVVHPSKDVSEAAAILGRWAAAHGVDLVASPSDAGRLGEGFRSADDALLPGGCDAIVSLGGDGTTLGALRLVAERPVPVLGVNFGKVGFLNEVEPAELPAALDRVVAGDVSIEDHAAIRVSSGDDEWVAFNDAVVVRVPGEGAVAATLSVDGARYGIYRCDAIVLSTSHGSTAYSYAAGGPVVSPAVAGMLVTPSAPMSGISRPLVLSDSEQVTLELDSGPAAPALEIDGRVVSRPAPGSALVTRLQLDAGRVVRLDAVRHWSRSQVKLSLLDLPLLPDELRALIPRRT